MLAGLKCRYRDRAVGDIRRADMNEIDLQTLIREHCLVVLINLGISCSVFLRGLLRSLADDVAERDEFSLVGICLERRKVLLVCDAAAADDRDSDLCHTCFPPD